VKNFDWQGNEKGAKIALKISRFFDFFDGEKRVLKGRQNRSGARPKTDSYTVFFGVASKDNGVIIHKKFSFTSIGQMERTLAIPRELQHRSIRSRRRAADRSAGIQIADLNITTIHRMVRQLLSHVPIHVFEIGA
jgi:hypothetical protein